MPVITVKWAEGRTDEQKKEVETAFTRELTRILNGDHGPIQVKFDERR